MCLTTTLWGYALSQTRTDNPMINSHVLYLLSYEDYEISLTRIALVPRVLQTPVLLLHQREFEVVMSGIEPPTLRHERSDIAIYLHHQRKKDYKILF